MDDPTAYTQISPENVDVSWSCRLPELKRAMLILLMLIQHYTAHNYRNWKVVSNYGNASALTDDALTRHRLLEINH